MKTKMTVATTIATTDSLIKDSNQIIMVKLTLTITGMEAAILENMAIKIINMESEADQVELISAKITKVILCTVRITNNRVMEEMDSDPRIEDIREAVPISMT